MAERGAPLKTKILFSAPTTRTPLPWGVFLWSFANLEEDLRDELPVKKASMMLFRGEISKRIRRAFAMTERKEYRALREKSRLFLFSTPHFSYEDMIISSYVGENIICVVLGIVLLFGDSVGVLGIVLVFGDSVGVWG